MATKPDPLSGRRLDSWKEIAAFLGRAQRTVKRWEIERGLPVHRVPGGGRSAVFAYGNELADWLKGESQELEADDLGSGEITDPGQAISEASKAEALAPRHGHDPVPEAAARSRAGARLRVWGALFVLAVGLIVYFSVRDNGLRFRAFAGRHPSNAPTQKLLGGPDSIAVLPFINERGNANSDYLSDGITESLIASLAHLPRLKVRSRDAVFRYKGKDVGVQEAGSNLSVSVVVTGRVTTHANTIEVSAELTDVRDNTEIWGHRYVARKTELISLQQQMAGDIAGRLRSSLTPAERDQVTNQGTEDAEAYSLYLRGRYAWNDRTWAKLETAISYFNQAIAKDPEYPLAYSGLADVYSVLPNYGGDPREEFAKSNAAARKALELDPTLARPHAVLGMNEFEYDWDFAGAESEFKKAIELDPNDATAHQWYAEKLAQLRRHHEALSEIDRAHELDPRSPVINRVIGTILLDAAQYDQAIAICEQVIQDNPTFAIAHDCLVYAYWGKHMYPEAIEEWKAYGQISGNPDNIKFSDALEQGFRAAGWKGAMAAGAAAFEARRRTGYASAFSIARFYADMGDTAKAFEWLDIAFREHDRLLTDLNVSPGFDSVRSDPRFSEMARKVGLPNQAE